MQNLPEAADRKKDDACAKNGTSLGKRKKPFLFRQKTVEWQHLKNSCCWWKAPRIHSKQHAG